MTLRIKIFWIYSILSCFLGANESFATTLIQSEFEMMLPHTFQQNLINQQWQSFEKESFQMSWDWPKQGYETPDVKVELEGLQLHLRTQFEKPLLSDYDNSIVLPSKNLEAELIAKAIVVDQYIVREIGGVIGRFRIQARCENLRLQMQKSKGTFELQLKPVFEKNLLKAQVVDVRGSWPADAWSLGPMVCTGATGFEDLIRDEILKLTKDTEIFAARKAVIMASIQQYADAKTVDLAKPRQWIKSRPDIMASLEVSDFTEELDHSKVRGLLKVEFSKGRRGQDAYLKLSSSPSPKENSKALLRIPESLLMAIANQMFHPGFKMKQISSKSIPGFDVLMNSRWNQFFVWPEILRFPKNTEFLFDVASNTGLRIQGHDLSYLLDSNLQAQMYVPIEGRFIPFMSFRIPVQTRLSLRIRQGKVFASFKDVNLSLNHHWDPEYVQHYRKYFEFRGPLLAKKIMESSEGKGLSYLLPKISLTDSLALQVGEAEIYPGGDLMLTLR